MLKKISLKKTGVEEKANSVSSLEEDCIYPITMTDGGNSGFFLEQTDASLEEL